MDEADFEGTLVLERLAAIDQVEAFFDAIDSDNFKLVLKLLREAGVDAETIQTVMKKIAEADFRH